MHQNDHSKTCQIHQEKYTIEEGNGCFHAPCIYIDECESLFDEARHFITINNKQASVSQSSEMHAKREGHTIQEDGVCSGLVFLARQQTKGRGRLGHTWLSEKDKSLLMVMVYEQSDEVRANKWNVQSLEQYRILTKTFALAIVLSIKQCYIQSKLVFDNVSLVIKYPNDIILQDKKIAGVLIESCYGWNLIGIGMNVRTYQWNNLSISGLLPISLADVDVHMEVTQVYSIVKQNIEQVLTMKKDVLEEYLCNHS